MLLSIVNDSDELPTPHKLVASKVIVYDPAWLYVIGDGTLIFEFGGFPFGKDH